jgi:hypothetical protein
MALGVVTLGDAIRKGAALRPQARYALLSTLNNGTCAIGAAADAVGYLKKLLATEDYGPLQKRWPVLTRQVKHPVRRELALLQSIVHNLNDQYTWTREEIAGFVDGIEVGLGSGPIPGSAPSAGAGNAKSRGRARKR